MGNVSKAKVNHPQIYHKKGIHHQNMGGLWHRITNINVVVHVPQSFGQIYGKSPWLLPLKLCGDLQAGRGPQHVCHIQWVAVSLRLPRRPSLADLEVPMGFWWWAARATVPLLKWLGIYIYIYTYIYTYTYIYIYISHWRWSPRGWPSLSCQPTTPVSSLPLGPERTGSGDSWELECGGCVAVVRFGWSPHNAATVRLNKDDSSRWPKESTENTWIFHSPACFSWNLLVLRRAGSILNQLGWQSDTLDCGWPLEHLVGEKKSGACKFDQKSNLHTKIFNLWASKMMFVHYTLHWKNVLYFSYVQKSTHIQ